MAFITVQAMRAWCSCVHDELMTSWIKFFGGCAGAEWTIVVTLKGRS